MLTLLLKPGMKVREVVQRGGRHFFLFSFSFLFFLFFFSFILERQTHKNMVLRTFYFDGKAGLSARHPKNKTTDDKSRKNEGDDVESDGEGGVVFGQGNGGDAAVEDHAAGEEDGGGSYENDGLNHFPGIISSFHSTP